MYKEKLKKIEAFKALSTRFKLPIDEMKKLMHSLRTSMVHEVKRVLANKDFVSTWKIFKSMEKARERSSFGMQAALGQLNTFHNNNNQVLIFHNMSAILAAILADFSNILFCAKLQQILLKLVENMCLQPQIGI